VYHHFDVTLGDGNGSLSVNELFHGLSTGLSGSLEDRAAFFFNLYDQDASGMLDLTEIHALLTLTRSGADDILRLGRPKGMEKARRQSTASSNSEGEVAGHSWQSSDDDDFDGSDGAKGFGHRGKSNGHSAFSKGQGVRSERSLEQKRRWKAR